MFILKLYWDVKYNIRGWLNLIFRGSFLFVVGGVGDVIELSAKIGFAFYCLLHYLIEFVYIFVHQFCCVFIQRVPKVVRLYVLQQVQKSHYHLVQLINRLPSWPQDWQTDIAVFINIGVQYFVEALDFWRLIGILFCSFEGEGYLWVPVERSLSAGYDLDVEFG